MTNQEGKYNIKAMCNLLGIQAGTLRAWERRYQLIEPVRNDAGHRLYTEEQLSMLKWIVLKIQQGFTVGQAVNLLNQDKHDIISQNQSLLQLDRTERLLHSMEDSLLRFEENKATAMLNEAFDVFSIDKVINEILSPLMIRIRSKWLKGEISTAHEHFATSFIRLRIGLLMNNYKANGLLPKVVAVCGPNEMYDLGLLFYALFLKRKGFDVIYLGSSIAKDDIHVVIKEISPKFIFLSATIEENAKETLEWSKVLSEQYKDISIGVGGHAFVEYPFSGMEQGENYIGNSTNDWEKWITKKL